MTLMLVAAGVMITDGIRQVRDHDPEFCWGKLGPGPRCAVLMLESCWFRRKGQ